jgi:hypothetical protein
MTDPKCNKCNKVTAKCVFFLIDVCPETQSHIDSDNGCVRMRLCVVYAEHEFDPAIHVGILKKTAALDYAHHVRKNDGDSSFFNKFVDDGIVVIDPTMTLLHKEY